MRLKQLALILTLLLSSTIARAQMFNGTAEVIKVYSQNERFYLKSIPYDDESPSLRGTSAVYEKGKPKPLYNLDRGFDVLQPNSLILSNDGDVIFYATTWAADEEQDGLKSINVYTHGALIRTFTEQQVNGCDKNKERCELVYNNFNEVVDLTKTQGEEKVFKTGTSEQERFLSEFPIFSFEDFVYLTDSKRVVHVFDLRNGDLARSQSFAEVFAELKTKARLTKVEEVSYAIPRFADFPKLADGRSAAISLANYIGMKAEDGGDRSPYKVYTVVVDCNLRRDGGVEIEKIEIDDGLPRQKILEFFNTHKFDSRPVPAVFPKWHLEDEYFYFRNKDIRQARLEHRQDEIKKQRDYELRLTLDMIEGVYIPRDLRECFVELDKQLSEIDKKEMRALPKRENMIRYHHSLGMWMRNNWGLWGGSRLQKYFRDRNVIHPDDMSGVILYHYHDWLNDKKDTWKSWEEGKKATP